MIYCHSPGGDTAAALSDRAFYTIYDIYPVTTGRQCIGLGQGSETRVDTQKTQRVFLVNPPKKTSKKPDKKTHPKFDPVSFLVLLITEDFIMFKGFTSTSSEFAK